MLTLSDFAGESCLTDVLVGFVLFSVNLLAASRIFILSKLWLNIYA